MTDLSKQIANLLDKIEQAEANIARLEQDKEQHRADQTLSRAGTQEHATAVARINEIESKLWAIKDDLKANTEALRAFQRRKKIMDDPAFQAQADKKVAVVKAESAKIDKALKSLEANIRKAAKNMLTIANAENDIREVHYQYDAHNHGRVSILTWMDDHFSFFTGKGAYMSREGMPDHPGTMYPAIKSVERDIRETMERKAADKARRG